MLLGPNCMGLADTAAGFQGVAYLDIPAGRRRPGVAERGHGRGVRGPAAGLGLRVLALRHARQPGRPDGGRGARRLRRARADAGRRPVRGGLRRRARAGRRRRGRHRRRAGRSCCWRPAAARPARARRARTRGRWRRARRRWTRVCRASGVVRAATPRELFELADGAARPPAALAPRGRDQRRRRARRHRRRRAPRRRASRSPRSARAPRPPCARRCPGAPAPTPWTSPSPPSSRTTSRGPCPPCATAARWTRCSPSGSWGTGRRGSRSSRSTRRRRCEAAEALAAAAAARDMPLVACTVYPDAAPAAALRAGGVPVYREIASGVGALCDALAAVAERRPRGCPLLPPPSRRCRRTPGYLASREALAAAGLSFPAARQRRRPRTEAAAAAAELGCPVVLKALGLLHKSDAGGVVVGLEGDAAVAAAARDLLERLRPPGLVVEAQAPVADGVELIIGCVRDARFGPLLMVGVRRRVRGDPPRHAHGAGAGRARGVRAGCSLELQGGAAADAARAGGRGSTWRPPPRRRPPCRGSRPPTPRWPRWRSTRCSCCRAARSRWTHAVSCEAGGQDATTEDRR